MTTTSRSYEADGTEVEGVAELACSDSLAIEPNSSGTHQSNDHWQGTSLQ